MKPAVAIHEPRHLSGETLNLLAWHIPDLVAYQHHPDEWWFAPLDDNLRTLRTHEANHVILANGLGRAGTSFMNEGLASAVISQSFAEIGGTFFYKWAAANRARLIPIGDLVDDSKWDSNSNVAYNTGAAFLTFLIDRYGVTRLKQVYYAGSADCARRFQEVYGRSLEALEAEWLSAI